MGLKSKWSAKITSAVRSANSVSRFLVKRMLSLKTQEGPIHRVKAKIFFDVCHINFFACSFIIPAGIKRYKSKENITIACTVISTNCASAFLRKV